MPCQNCIFITAAVKGTACSQQYPCATGKVLKIAMCSTCDKPVTACQCPMGERKVTTLWKAA